jgi:hypothetical protein
LSGYAFCCTVRDIHLHYSKKKNIALPEREKIEEIVSRAIAIADKLPRSNAA